MSNRMRKRERERERERERDIVKLKEIIFSAREDRKRINE